MTAKRKAKGPKLVQLPEVCAKDIAAQFVKMAEDIRNGEIEHIESMVSVAEIDGEIRLFGWGNIDGMRAIGMLSLGSAKLTTQTLEWMEVENDQ